MKYFHKTIIWFTYISPIVFIPLAILTPALRSDYGKKFGTIALLLFVITLIPSIIQRFGLSKQFSLIIKLILPVRRQFGILMFMAAFTHYLAMKVIPVIQYKLPVYLPLYQAFGVLAMILTFLMFLTSNNWATRKLKGDWKRLHRATYLIGWLIFGHVLLGGLNSEGEISLQAILIGTIMVLEVASLIKARVNVLS
jgi:DMSO/TMAO reductase YedYZ heme-binding membrane subunit